LEVLLETAIVVEDGRGEQRLPALDLRAVR
jgi:hypothetical protein